MDLRDIPYPHPLICHEMVMEKPGLREGMAFPRPQEDSFREEQWIQELLVTPASLQGGP